VGEAYFAEKLLDYEMSSNVGNWQWAAGTGCDATYFRVFNPSIQLKNSMKKVFILGSGFLNLNSVTESLW
jgi:deoxyribodipyrimidine photo-lyase